LQNKGRHQGLTIEEAGPLIAGLLHTRRTVLLLQNYAQQMTTLTTPDQTTIVDHIKLTNQALCAIEQVLPRPTDPLRGIRRASRSVNGDHSADS